MNPLHRARRLIARFGGQLNELQDQVRRLESHHGSTHRRLDGVEARLGALDAQLATADARLVDLGDRLDRDLRPLLLALVRDDPWHRRELAALRASEAYELPYAEADPLVSVVICAQADRSHLLLERTLPSALAQTHANLEVVIVGDAAGPELAAAVAAVGDPRIRFADLTQRFVHPDPNRRWLTSSTMPRNEAHRLSRGRWIVELDDDDALRCDAIAQLLALARRDRLEVAYGVIEEHWPDGRTEHLGRFPPAIRPLGNGERLPYVPWDGTASPGALAHAGLSFFAREHVAAEVPAPGDYFRLERMVRAGVRFGMLDEVVYDYYPSTVWRR